MFKVIRKIKKERKDVIRVKFIKGEDGEIKTVEEDILRRWQQYFKELLIEENEWNKDNGNAVEGRVEELRQKK